MHELRTMGWEAYALEGGFSAWRDKFGAEELSPVAEETITPAYDRL